MSLNILINPVPRHHRAEQLSLWLGDLLAVDFDAGVEHSLGLSHVDSGDFDFVFCVKGLHREYEIEVTAVYV